MKFIFAFLLLATLSMVVNAIPHQLHKRTTTFAQCPPVNPEDPPPPLLNVVLSPDPVVAGQTDSFTISGTLSRPVTDDDITGVGFFDPVAKAPVGDPTTAPTEHNKPFSQVLKVDVPSPLPSTYGILVAVGNPTTVDIIGCALAIVGDSPGSADLDYYPIPL